MRNFVYWNIYDKVFTVQNQETGRVRRHAEVLTLRDVDFEIDQAERERMVQEGRKTLHAGVRGEIMPDPPENLEGWLEVIYEPLAYDSFVTSESREPVARAEWLHMMVEDRKARLFAKGLTYKDR